MDQNITSNVVKDSYQILCYVNKSMNGHDSKTFHEIELKINNFYNFQQNSDCESESYSKIGDKLLTIWKTSNNLNKRYGADKISKINRIYDEFMKKTNTLTSLLFSDLITLWVYMVAEDVPDNADINEICSQKIPTKYGREVTMDNIKKNMDKFSHPHLNNVTTNVLNAKNILQREHPIVPIDGKKNILITAALPYVNNVPHLGNIIGCVLSGDVYSRYCRLRSYNSLFICGTDEYGTATEIKAESEGLSCQEVCDKYHALHADIYKWFEIDFDYFGRTTNPHQTEISQKIFHKMHSKGVFLNKEVTQLYCSKCERFLADRLVEGICPFCSYENCRGDQCDSCAKLIDTTELKEPKCKICGNSPDLRSTNHLFFDLPKMEQEVHDWVSQSSTEGIWSNNAKAITQCWFNEGLLPRCVTRDLKWGTPVPHEDFKEKVFYVWFDAPIGYLSITASYTINHWKEWWNSHSSNRPNVRLVQFMGKDNVTFHSIIFPATLLAASDTYTMLNDLSCTEYLQYEGQKFSKSKGIGVFGSDAKESGISADIYRYYLLSTRPENQDSTFSWSDLIAKNNGDLLNNFGNFVNRCINFVKKNYDGHVPAYNFRKEESEFVCVLNQILNDYINSMENYRMKDALKYILELTRCGNLYIQENKPWLLIKSADENDKQICGTICAVTINMCLLVAGLLHPFMPETCRKICQQLNVPEHCVRIKNTFNMVLQKDHVIGEAKPLFVKLPPELVESMYAKYGGGNEAKVSVKKPVLSKSEIDYVNNLKSEEVEVAIKLKGDTIRKLKSTSAEKEIIDKEVAILLALKKRLKA